MISYLLKIIKQEFGYLYNCWIVRRNKVNVVTMPKINGYLKVANFGGEISLGENIVINSSPSFNQIGGDTVTRLITSKGSIRIGNNVGISNSTLISQNSILVEDDVCIGGSCKIYDTDFHSIDYVKRMMKPDIDIRTAPIRIKKGAFIGAHCIILKGVTIGEKSIIGAGSVVTKDIPNGEIWAGNPAKFIRKAD